MEQRTDNDPTPVPKDARETTEGQRQEEEQLEHQDVEVDPDAPGSHQSRHQLPDESTR